jgi:hypothetical protein
MQHDYLANLRIAVTISTPDLDTFYGPSTQGGTLHSGGYDLTTSFNGYLSSDPLPRVDQFTSREIPSAQKPFGSNIGGVSDSTIDTQSAEGLQALDFLQRKHLYWSLIRYIAARTSSSRCTSRIPSRSRGTRSATICSIRSPRSSPGAWRNGTLALSRST